MTQEERNDIDIMRMARKRAYALRALDEFKEWRTNKVNPQVAEQMVIMGITRDILRGTEEEVDRITANLEEKNQESLLKKLSD